MELIKQENSISNENKKFIETPDTVHGRLLESLHISGYTMERAVIAYKWLLEENRWKLVSNKFANNFNDFLKTVDVSHFKIETKDRKDIVKMIAEINKEENKPATQRTIAKTFGVDVGTINKDINIVENSTSNKNINDKNQDNDKLKIKSVENSTNNILSKEPKEILKPIERKENKSI